MKIVLDNIVFSLQKSGGISTLWGELINFFHNRDVIYLDYPNGSNNIVRRNFDLNSNQVIYNDTKYLSIIRYLNPKLEFLKEKFIFVSSYYRTSSNKNAYNITIVHDFTYEYFSSGLKKWIHFLQKKSAILKSDIVICISENTKKDLLKFIPEVDHNKIFVVYNGVANCFSKLSDLEINNLDEKFTKLKIKRNILFVGSRVGYKNFEKVIEFFPSIDEDEYHLLIVGNPLSEREKILLNRKVGHCSYTVLSNISNEDLNIIYNISYCLIYPSYYEGFGIPPVEAMKAGLPVIGFNGSSLPEVVNGAAILLSDLSPNVILDSLKKLECRDYRNDLIRKGYQNAKKFSWKKTMTSYEDIFKKLNNENLNHNSLL